MDPKKIVLIDDESLIRITTSMLLKHRGYEVFIAENGQKGIDLVIKEMPDLILLDVMMPDMDGWEVLRRLKMDEKTTGIEIIMFTACEVPCPDDIVNQFGTVIILEKPFKIKELIKVISASESGNKKIS